METASLHCLLLIEENQEEIISNIKKIQDKLQYFASFNRINSRYEIIMFEWVLFSVEGVEWNMGIQLQEVIENIGSPVIFIGNHGSGLSDLANLNKGHFDQYFISLLSDTDRLEEFITSFMPFTTILDYALTIWNDQLLRIDDLDLLKQLMTEINYAPLHSLLQERIDELTPQHDDDQTSLDDFF